VIDSAPIGNCRHHARCEERLDLRGKEQPIALPRPIEWADAKSIAKQHEAARRFIPERDGELAAKLLKHRFAIFLPHVGQNLGVAMCVKAMTARLELCALFDVIEELAVEDDVHRFVLIGHRLLSIRETDDAQTAGCEGKSSSMEESLFIGSTMDDGTSHAPDEFVRHGALSA